MASSQKEVLNDPFRYLYIDVLNAKCKKCDEILSKVTPRKIWDHFTTKHHDDFELKRFSGITNKLDYILECNKGRDYRMFQSKTNKEQVEQYCCNVCDKTFDDRRDNFVRHGKIHEIGPLAKKPCYYLELGGTARIPPEQLVARSTTDASSIANSKLAIPFQPSLICGLTAADISTAQLKEKAKRFVQEGELLGNYPKVFILFLKMENGEDWANSMKTQVEAIMKKETPLELQRLFDAGDYFFDRCYSQVHLVPAGVRASIQKFDELNFSDESAYVFKERMSYQDVKRSFRRLMAYVYIDDTYFLDTYTSYVDRSNQEYSPKNTFLNCMVGILLTNLASQGNAEFGGLTLILKFAQLELLIKTSKGLRFVSPGVGAKKLSTLLHMIRMGVIASLYTNEFKLEEMEKMKEFTASINQTYNIQMISPWLRYLRNSDENRPNTRRIEVDIHQNIIIDGIVFKKSIWKNLIPRLYDLVSKELKRFFLGKRI